MFDYFITKQTGEQRKLQKIFCHILCWILEKEKGPLSEGAVSEADWGSSAYRAPSVFGLRRIHLPLGGRLLGVTEPE